MADYDYDLFIIGAGSGGVRAGRMATSYGARVGIAEDSRVGGTCVIRGCVPKKLLVYASQFGEEFEWAHGFGWTVEGARFDWQTLIANKDKEIDRLNGLYLQTLKNNNVVLHEARAEMVDAHTVRLVKNGAEVERVTADKILIATGGWPAMPDIPGIEHAISSNEAFHLEEFPKRVVIAGGGYIAVEFAGIFNGLGAQVVQLYRSEQILRGFDRDIRDTVANEMRKKGIDLRVNCSLIARIDKQADGSLLVTQESGETIETDAVLYAIGRHPKTTGMNLAEIGVALNEIGAVIVDDDFRTSVPNIFALGDVTHRFQLTPVAIAEAMAFTATQFAGRPTSMDYRDIPTAVFTQPPIGTCGLTEEEARARYDEIDIYKADFRPMKHTLGGASERTMMKLIVDAKTDRVLGAHMVGADAGEIIQGVGIAIKCGATKAQFDQTVAIHPTAAEEFVTMRTPVPRMQQAAE
ncbi:glutathione-disulfide reductase [Iodidimonas sp. SYSU 1G8]|uniref:glutathione-disulfide reductase n=1 Tax=Iodidimonas sp. SYSU 1G8 TaxID=3133967 RepID=UPI0031FF223A